MEKVVDLLKKIVSNVSREHSYSLRFITILYIVWRGGGADTPRMGHEERRITFAPRRKYDRVVRGGDAALRQTTLATGCCCCCR